MCRRKKADSPQHATQLNAFVKRAERARLLATNFPASREALELIADICDLQASWNVGPPLIGLPALVELVAAKGPKPLAELAQTLNEQTAGQAIDEYLTGHDTTSPASFFARVLLQPCMVDYEPAEAPSTNRVCPRCGHLPQVGCLRSQGDGQKLSLVCSLCLGEWDFPRGECPACGGIDQDSIAYYQADEISHLKTMACEKCGRYIHLADFEKDAAIVPHIDELIALPLDVWAAEKGYRKVHPNLAGA